MSKLLRFGPIPFAGLYEEATELPSEYGDYIGLIYERSHFTLFGRLGDRLLLADSSRLQQTNVCGLYCFLFSLAFYADPYEAERLFHALNEDKSSISRRLINDQLVIDMLRGLLNGWNA